MKEQKRSDKFNNKLAEYMNNMEEEKKREKAKEANRMKKTIQRKMFEMLTQQKQMETEVTENSKSPFGQKE
jgi:hypothetical protein